MRFRDLFKFILSADVKTRASVKIRLFGVPLVKIRTKRICFAVLNVKDRAFYRSNHDVLALKCPAPPDAGRLTWGDYWITEDLKRQFEKTGQTTRIDYVDRYSYPMDSKNARTLTIRGLTGYTPPKTGKHILFLLSHPERVPVEEMNRFHRVACASLTYAEKLKKQGIACGFVPQFTDPAKFRPEFSEQLRVPLLFVGNSRGVFRNGVKYALEQSLPLTVYGSDWERFGIKKAGNGIPNTELNKYYSSADIVLCDHWADMASNGFIANRIFDASACGVFVISDYSEEIERLYQGNVPMYRNASELKSLVEYYLNHPEERRRKAELAKETTLKNFTVQNAVDRLNALFEED